MKREEAVSLLKEIINQCESFHSAQAISVSKDEKTQGWVLSAQWVRPELEKHCLDKIVAKHKIEVLEQNGQTIFRALT